MEGWYVAAGVTIGLGCLWLAADFARCGNRPFALLFGLLAVERVFQLTAGGTVQPGGLALAGFVVSGVGVALALAVVLVRVTVGRVLYVLMKRRKVAFGSS